MPDSLEDRISFCLLACFLIALPFAHFFSEILLSCFCVHTLIHLRKDRLSRLRNPAVWVISSVFFINLLTISYSAYPAEGFKNVSQQLGILLFPVSFCLTRLDLDRYKIPLLKIFAYTCVFTILYLYVDAFRVISHFHSSFTSILSRAFINQNFSVPIGLHATYLSMYAALSVSIFLYLCFVPGTGSRWRYITGIAVLSAGIIQLSSRSVFISLCLVALIAFPFLMLQGKKKILFILISGLSFVILLLVIIHSSSLKKRYLSDLEDDLSENAVMADFSETRMQRWNLELTLIGRSPLTGYGNGSEKFILMDNYFKNRFYRSYLLRLNAHSQYLSFWLTDGIAGLLLYLFVLYYGLSAAIKKRDFLLCSFLILLAVVSVSENILDVNKGVFFYSFFYALFLVSTRKEKTAPGYSL
jgi:O-antigen ligase